MTTRNQSKMTEEHAKARRGGPWWADAGRTLAPLLVAGVLAASFGSGCGGGGELGQADAPAPQPAATTGAADPSTTPEVDNPPSPLAEPEKQGRMVFEQETLATDPTMARAQFGATTLFWPLQAYTATSYHFGQWETRRGQYHLGQDVAGRAGTPVYAIANGEVVWAQENGGYGGLVVIEHELPGGVVVRSLYGHMRARDLQVRAGWQVGRGRLLGWLGTYAENGNYGEHLHFGIKKGKHPGYFDYPGYGNSAELAKWENPGNFVNSRLPWPHDPNPIPLAADGTRNWCRLARGYYQRYRVSVSPGRDYQLQLSALSGDPDLYIGTNSDISPQKYALKAIRSGSDSLRFRVSQPCIVYIAVHAYSDASWEVQIR